MHIHTCVPVQGLDPKEQKAIDNKMIDLDGTDNKGKLGARSILHLTTLVAVLSYHACELQHKGRF